LEASNVDYKLHCALRLTLLLSKCFAKSLKTFCTAHCRNKQRCIKLQQSIKVSKLPCICRHAMLATANQLDNRHPLKMQL